MKGWILDIYPWKNHEIIVWLKTENGAVRLVDKWSPSIYVSGSLEDLKLLTQVLATNRDTVNFEFEKRYIRLEHTEKSVVLRIKAHNCMKLAEEIQQYGRYKKYQIHNLGIPQSQFYLYEKDLFPLAYVDAEPDGLSIKWTVKDSVESKNYTLPPFKIMKLNICMDSKIPNLRSPVRKITMEIDNACFSIDSGTEKEKLLRVVENVKQEDPDIILTRGGDSLFLPYLSRRGLANGISEKLILGRENVGLNVIKNRGNVYFSYGRIYYRPRPCRFLGRIHIDTENVLYADCGLEGLIEISRVCRMPLQRVANSTIGTAMTSLQIYQAMRDGILIPWEKSEPENFKNAEELLTADRGGFYFEPKIGIHDNVGEIDFASMYPTLMMKKNISPETVNCSCCPDSSEHVPELGYHICQRKRGIVPKTLELLLKKREDYKQLRNKAKDAETRKRYDQRQAALKWILVCSFGYLGFKNARFGKVDAHIAVCAYARDVLLNTARLAEQRGFEIVHGIVDCLWLKKYNAKTEDFTNLCHEIQEKLHLPISFEGQYRWIVFLPSKIHPSVPTLSRFYGVFKDGRIKVRGLEVRRYDTPIFIQKCQKEIIRTLAKTQNSREYVKLIPEAIKIVERYKERLASHKVDPSELIIVKQLSKNPDEYAHNVSHAIAAKMLVKAGIPTSAGQRIGYVITDRKRTTPAEFVDENTKYDAKKYIELLNLAVSNLLLPCIENKL